MNKKKIIIIIIVLLLLGIIVYSFAVKPTAEPEQPDDNNPPTEQQDGEDDDQQTTPSDEEDDDQSQDEPEDDTAVSGDGTIDQEEPIDYLALAQEAVAKAEQSLTQSDIDIAKDAINEVENSDVSDLVDRIENVQNVVDFESLFKELEEKTNSSTNKAQLDEARNYNTTNDLTTKLNDLLEKLVENDTKTSLENRYKTVLAKLNDISAPSIDAGIQKGEFTKGPVSLTITDDSSFKATLSKNGVEIGTYVTGDEIEEDGKYTLTLVDSSFNKNVIEFVINNTDPVIALPTLKENIFTNDGTINVTDDIEFEVVITLDGETKDTITATVQTDGTYLATLDLSQYGKGEYTITATDKAGNTVTSATFDFDATGALVTNIDELNAALSDNTIETIYLNNDITDLTSRVVVNRAVTINGNNHKLTFTDAINTATYGEKQGIVVNANDVVINDLTVEMNAIDNEAWTGTYAIQVYNGTATLNNITATKADGGIFANNSTITLTGTIDVSGNEFGGIEVSNGNPVLNATEATLVNTTEEFKKPTIWTDKTPNAVVNVKDMFENKHVKDEQVQYYLNENNIEGSEMTTNVNDIYTSTDLNQPTSITPNASATITVYKSYTNIRFRVENFNTPDGANVKVWAQDTNGNIWDMVTAGWGPEAGFPVEAGYTAATPFQIVVDKAGSYSADIVLYDVLTNEEISRQEISFEANLIVSNETELSESLADSTIDTIYLPADFTSTTTTLDINRPVTIIGNGATLNNQVIISGDNVVLEDVVLTDDLTVTGENAILDEVTISGVTSTGTGNGSGHTVVKVDTTGDFTMTNSTIDNASSTGSFYNALNIKATGVVTIEDNNFTNMNNVYNVIEFSQSVATANGTTIKGNTFTGQSKNNVINLFLFEEGTVINIEDNEFAYASNAVRVSNYNNVSDVTINITNNEYKDSSSGAYAGFMLFQEVKNESFNGITVNVTNLIGPSGEKVTADSTDKDRFCYYYFNHTTNTGEAIINFLD